MVCVDTNYGSEDGLRGQNMGARMGCGDTNHGGGFRLVYMALDAVKQWLVFKLTSCLHGIAP